MKSNKTRLYFNNRAFCLFGAELTRLRVRQRNTRNTKILRSSKVYTFLNFKFRLIYFKELHIGYGKNDIFLTKNDKKIQMNKKGTCL